MVRRRNFFNERKMHQNGNHSADARHNGKSLEEPRLNPYPKRGAPGQTLPHDGKFTSKSRERSLPLLLETALLTLSTAPDYAAEAQ